MIVYFRNLQTQNVIEFRNLDSVGDIFFNTSLYVQLQGTAIDQYLLDSARSKKLQQLLVVKNFQMNNIKTTYNGHVYDFHDINKTFSFMALAFFNKIMGNELSTTWDTVDNGPITLTNADSLEMIGQFLNYFLNQRPVLYQNLLDQINNATTIDEINAIVIDI